MWQMKTQIKDLYENGYYLTGKYNRVDIIDPFGNKVIEIFFFGSKDIRIRKGKCWWTVNEIFNIVLDENGQPTVETPGLTI